jgi:hypothetical protein
MTTNARQLATGRAALTALGHAGELEDLWLALTRTDWVSLVFVPADPGSSSAALVTALAEVGSRLSRETVSPLMLDIDQDPAVLADVQQLLLRERRRADLRVPRVVGESAGSAGDVAPPPPESVPTPARTILSIPPLAGAPLGAGVARAADAVVVTVAMGRTRLADVRRTTELVGRERVAGCCIVR